MTDPHEDIRREMVHALKHIERGDFALAEDCYASALEAAIEVEGTESRLAHTILGYMAKASGAQGKHNMAITLYERQLAITETLCDETSIKLELLDLYRKIGRDDEADSLAGQVTVAIDRLKHSFDTSDEEDDEDDDTTVQSEATNDPSIHDQACSSP